MSSQISLTISIIMITLFSIAIIGFSISFANDNDATMSVADDPEMSSLYTGTKTNLSQFKGESEDTYQSILETTVEPGSDVIPSAAPFAITISGLIGVFTNILTLPLRVIFGGWGSPFGIFFTVLISILSFMFILFLIKTWKGNP